MKLELKKNKDLFNIISEVSFEIKIPAYIVGGYVRDLLLGRENDDVDIVVLGSGPYFAKELSKRIGSRVTIFKNFGTAKLDYKGIEVEIVGARKESYRRESRKPVVEGGTLNDDLERRDFTINTLAISLWKNNFGTLIDLFGGRKDLENKILRTPIDPEVTFSDDPLRMFRAIRFSSQLGFDIADNTFNAIINNKDRINILSGERITVELNKIIMSPDPRKGFIILLNTGLLELILPELTALNGEGDQVVKHKNHLIHSLNVLQNLSMQSDNPWLRWAALLHDIGKPKSAKFSMKTGWTYHYHEVAGSKMIEPIFRRLKLPLGANLKYVEKMVYMHMRLEAIDPSSVSDSGLRRFMNDAGDDYKDLILLISCDITSNHPEKLEKSKKKMEKIKAMCEDLVARDYKRLFKPVIAGHEIIKIIGRDGGIVGEIKEAMIDAIIAGDLENKEDVLTNFVKEKYNDICRKQEENNTGGDEPEKDNK